MEFGSKILGNTLFKKIMELSFYGQFVAGEDQDKIQPIVTRYREFGVKSILDYSIERDISESETVQKIEYVVHLFFNVPHSILCVLLG